MLLKSQKIEKIVEEANLSGMINLKIEISSTNNYSIGKHISKESTSANIPKLTYFARESDRNNLKSLEDHLFEILPKNIWEIYSEFHETVKITPDKICALCNSILARKDHQYINYWEGRSYCVNCAEQCPINSKIPQITDNLIFVNVG